MPSFKVLPLIKVQSDPTQPQVSPSVSNNQTQVLVINGQNQLVTAGHNQLVTVGHNQLITGHHVVMLPCKKVQEEVDYRSTPQYQEFMKQKMLKMKKAEERRVRFFYQVSGLIGYNLGLAEN